MAQKVLDLHMGWSVMFKCMITNGLFKTAALQYLDDTVYT
jgi:hypothetical protein